jgi:hypothetical protein
MSSYCCRHNRASSQNGKDVWALSGSGVRSHPHPRRQHRCAQAERRPPDADDLGDGVTADASFPTCIIPGLGRSTATRRPRSRRARVRVSVTRISSVPLRLASHNRVAARRLARHPPLARAGAALRQQGREARAHRSFDGRTRRAVFLECLDGWRDTRMLITFGCPTAVAERARLHRRRFRSGLPDRASGSTGSAVFTRRSAASAVYVLRDGSREAHARRGDLQGPGTRSDSRRRRLAFHRGIEGAVDAHRRGCVSAAVTSSIRSSARTSRRSVGALARRQARMLRSYPGRDYDGDGTVPDLGDTDRAGRQGRAGCSSRCTVRCRTPAGAGAGRGLLSRVRKTSCGAHAPRVSLTLDDAYRVERSDHGRCEQSRRPSGDRGERADGTRRGAAR